MAEDKIVLDNWGADDIEFNRDTILSAVFGFLHSPAAESIIETMVSFNEGYKGSWSQDGPFINLGDIKDKLTRYQVLVEDGELKARQETMDKMGNVIFDLWVRATMAMLYNNEFKKMVSKRYGIDFDLTQLGDNDVRQTETQFNS